MSGMCGKHNSTMLSSGSIGDKIASIAYLIILLGIVPNGQRAEFRCGSRQICSLSDPVSKKQLYLPLILVDVSVNEPAC